MSLETPNAVETLKKTVKPNMDQDEINKLKLGIEELSPEQQAEFREFLSETTTNAKDALLNLKEDIPKDTIPVSETFAKLMKDNQELARMGARIEGNQIILPQGFEHQEKIKKLERVVYYIDFLSNPIDKTNETERIKNQDEKLKIYFELSNENTDWILDRRFLKMKYIASMYEDIRNEGGILVKKDGKYSLEKDGQPVNNHPYAKLLDPNFVNQNDLDFAVLFSIANTDNRMEQEGFVTQKGLIKRLLEKHRIVTEQSDGEELQEAELLLIDWTSAEEQINTKMTAAKTSNKGDYQELVFLKNYINQKEYLSVEYNRNLFTDVNEYRNLYLAEKGLYDVLKANNGKNMTPENYGDMIANTAKEYQLPLGALGILLLLFKDTRKWGLGALGAAIGLPIVGGIASKVENAAKGNKSGSVFTDEQLGLLKLRDIKPFTEDLRSEETPVLQAITAKNEEYLRESSTKQFAIYYPQTLTATYKAIKGIDATTLQDISSDNITSKSQEIFSKIGNNQQVEGLKDGTYITFKDVQKLLQLLSATKDATDENLLDMVVEGKHILNTPYEHKTITNSPFDTRLNEILEKHYDTTSDSQEKRTKLTHFIDKIVSENNTYLQYIESLKNIGQGGKVLAEPDIQLVWKNILSEAGRINPILKTELEPIVTTYTVFEKTTLKVAEFSGWIDENTPEAHLALAKLLGIIPTEITTQLSDDQKIILERSILTKVQSLEGIKKELTDLKNNNSQEIQGLIQEKSDEVGKLITRLNGTKANLNVRQTTEIAEEETTATDIQADFTSEERIATLKSNIADHYTSFKTLVGKKFVNPDKTGDFSQLSADMEAIQTSVSTLDNYNTALAGFTPSTPSTLSTVLGFQKDIKDMLADFDIERSSLKKKAVAPFESLNSKMLEHTQTITDFDINDHKPENINKLQSVAHFLQAHSEYEFNYSIPATPLTPSIDLNTKVGTTLAQRDEMITALLDDYNKTFKDEKTFPKTFETLKNEYTAKKEAYLAAVQTYVQTLAIDSINFTTAYKNLAQLEAAFANDSSLLGTIQAKKAECREKYFETTKVESLDSGYLNKLTASIPTVDTSLSSLLTKYRSSTLDSFLTNIQTEYEVGKNLPSSFITTFEEIKKESANKKLN